MPNKLWLVVATDGDEYPVQLLLMPEGVRPTPNGDDPATPDVMTLSAKEAWDAFGIKMVPGMVKQFSRGKFR